MSEFSDKQLQSKSFNLDIFYRTHKYLIEHLGRHLRRGLMDEIDWSNRLICIRGSRGVGKTTFLLDYAREKFGDDTACLYVNLNSFYFTAITLTDFARLFINRGGRVLLLDQIHKYPNWSSELKQCYDLFPTLKIVFTCSSVMRLYEAGSEIKDIAVTYNLRGLSFREYINLKTGTNLPSYTLEDILDNHEKIAADIMSNVNPEVYINDYLYHGYYPLFTEQSSYNENLIKTVNMILEVDILLLKQIESGYLSKMRLLLFKLANTENFAPNISQISTDIGVSRATVMNYIKYLKDARLINILYEAGEDYPKKPDRIYLQNTNLMFLFKDKEEDVKALYETFIFNQMIKGRVVNRGDKAYQFLVDGKYRIQISGAGSRSKSRSDVFYAIPGIYQGEANKIPAYLFGFLY